MDKEDFIFSSFLVGATILFVGAILGIIFTIAGCNHIIYEDIDIGSCIIGVTFTGFITTQISLLAMVIFLEK